MTPADTPDGATPLTWQEQQGIRLSWVTTRADLNQAEQDNIVAADAWARRRRRPEQVVDEPFLLELHRRMFGQVWQWAGSYRITERNIGVDHWEIRPEMRNLLADVRLWIDADARKSMPADEAAVRFHHRLVWIHPFPNGNGRHARRAADVLVASLGRAAFTWGRNSIDAGGETRAKYLDALRAADAHDLGPLIVFARS